jgi:hypothetical protein
MYYSGVFFEGPFDSLLRDKVETKLDKPIDDLHVTFNFNPKEEHKLPKELIGKEIPLKVVGEGNDGKNHGYEVELPNMDFIINGERVTLKSLYRNPATPHITMSLAPGGKAVDTKYLDFSRIEPFDVVGKLGFVTVGLKY